MRISEIQRNVLFMLFAIEQRGNKAAIPNAALYSAVSSNSAYPLQPQNFRASCHTMQGHQLVTKYRLGSTVRVAWRLTDTGRALAETIFNERMTEGE